MGAYVCAYLKRPAAGIFSSMLLLLALPAEAHHPGGGGNTGSGGPINTISADTLSEGLIAASVRYEFIRLGQLSDADLLAAASQGHARAFDPLDRQPSRFRSPTASPMTSPSAFAPPASAARISASPREDMLSGGHMGIDEHERHEQPDEPRRHQPARQLGGLRRRDHARAIPLPQQRADRNVGRRAVRLQGADR